MKSLLAVLLSFLFSYTAYSQDLLYTSDGLKTEVKILEIKPNEIRFKKASNPDGPDYVMSKKEIVLITYANGTFESFGVKASDGSSKKRIDTLSTTYGKNYIAYNTFAILLTNMTFSYERIFSKGLIGLRVPLTIGFGNNRVDWYDNSNISEGTIVAAGLDINIYPNRQGKTRYFIAPSFLVTSFNYEDYNQWNYPSKTALQYAVMIKHGLLMQITPHFNMSCVFGLGISQNETDYDDYTRTKASFEFNVGYKF